VQAQRPQAGAVRNRIDRLRRGPRYENLAAVSQCPQPHGLVHSGPDVVAVEPLRRPAVDSHPHAHRRRRRPALAGEGQLQVDCAGASGGGLVEDGERAVALDPRFDDRPAVHGDELRGEPVVASARRGQLASLPERRRAFDVGDEKCDGQAANSLGARGT
jgi:hypothetical protein